MNKWECEYPGCKSTAVGTGGAVGLRAIGWWFVRGMSNNIFCPAHRPDPIRCLEQADYHECRNCAGELEADKWQRQMEAGLGWEVSEPHEQWVRRVVQS